jgi:catechol 2,3-dioxygenase-like lactoylglutathione lyase family enzyme
MLDNSKPICFLTTSDANSARNFYDKTLGLTLIYEDSFALVFDIEGIMLRIQKVKKVTPGEYTCFGWEVGDIKGLVANLTKRGVKFSIYPGMAQDHYGIWEAPGKAKIAWFKDPDGNVLSLTEF